MKTLLYATDFSDNSIPAFHFAAMVRERLDAQLYVLHVFDMKATFISTVSLTYAKREEIMFKEQTEKLETFCKKHLAMNVLPEYIIPVIHENSIPTDGILQKVESLNADLIFIGTKGSSLLKDLFLGSTASSLITKSYIPVISIPLETMVRPLKKIVYATAFEEADILAIRKLVALAEPFQAEIALIHVSTKTEYAGEDQMAWFKEMLESKISYANFSFDLRFSEDIFKSLLGYLDEVDADMMAMLEREGYSVIKSLWHQDTVMRMKTLIHRPLLSFHKKNL
jgi:nucleotide-binding universal stress UspA family protein